MLAFACQEAAVKSAVASFYEPLGISIVEPPGISIVEPSGRSIVEPTDFGTHADSTAEDACARACAAAWTAACFREQEFVSIWQQTQWPSDGFVAGATRCEGAARMALAHAVVGCSSSLAKGLAARKETDARRIFMANQMKQADATRIAMANLPDDFPLLDYPHNTSHHMYLWSPNV